MDYGSPNFLGSGAYPMGGNPGVLNQQAGYSRDAFGRIVTGTPTTIMTSHPAFTPQYELMDYHSTGTGYISTISISSITILQASGSGGRAIRQSHEYQLYQPGKSHLASFTLFPHYLGTFDKSVACRAGIFDDYRDKNTPAGTTGAAPYLFMSSIYGGSGQETNQPSMGHYFELSGNEWFVVERYNSPNNIENVNRVPQRLWNVDTFNPKLGANPSGFILPVGQRTGLLLWIERQWLGVGYVRLGAYFNGKAVVCHIFTLRGYGLPYTHSNKLPVRYEIEKVAGGSSQNAIMASVCESSHIMGEYTPLGQIFSLPANLILTPTTATNVLTPLLCIRLQQLYCRATFKLKDIEMYISNNQPIAYSVFRNPIITGSLTWVKHPNPESMIEYALFPNATGSVVSGGLCLRSGFVNANTTLQESLSVTELLTATSFTSNIHGVPDILCLAGARVLNNDSTVFSNLRWIEIV